MLKAIKVELLPDSLNLGCSQCSSQARWIEFLEDDYGTLLEIFSTECVDCSLIRMEVLAHAQ